MFSIQLLVGFSAELLNKIQNKKSGYFDAVVKLHFHHTAGFHTERGGGENPGKSPSKRLLATICEYH